MTCENIHSAVNYSVFAIVFSERSYDSKYSVYRNLTADYREVCGCITVCLKVTDAVAVVVGTGDIIQVFLYQSCLLPYLQ